MTQLETIAVLLNGGHIEWMHPADPGPSYYKVLLPSRSETEAVGWITDRMACDLFKAGFLIAGAGSDVIVRDDGYTVTILRAGPGSLAFLDGRNRKRDRSVPRR